MYVESSDHDDQPAHLIFTIGRQDVWTDQMIQKLIWLQMGGLSSF